MPYLWHLHRKLGTWLKFEPCREVAFSLSQLAAGVAAPQVAQSDSLTAKVIRELAHRYSGGGLDRALYDKQRPGASQILDASQKQRIVAVVCSQPPEGRARWTVRLVAKEAIGRKLVPRVGRETIRVLLERHDLKPWREKNVVRGRRPGSASARWRTCWRCTRSSITLLSLSYAWTRRRYRCIARYAPQYRSSPAHPQNATTNTKVAVQRMYLALWSRKQVGISLAPSSGHGQA
jgi:putative transposase